MARSRRRPWVRRLLMVALAAVLVLGGALIALLVATPSATDAPERVQAQLVAHHAPSDDGIIPAKVAAALLATEDSRFYHDPAIDPRGLARAVGGTVTGNTNTGGATIEVQLAKLLWTPGRSGALAELEQAGLAIKLDHDFTKHQILAMYLNAAYFGDGAYGITSAASHYFGLPADRLSWGQASLLAGLVQAPTDYDPHGHLHLALERRRHVLARLVATGTLTATESSTAAAAPLHPAVLFYG